MDTDKDRVGKYTPTAALGPFVGGTCLSQSLQ